MERFYELACVSFFSEAAPARGSPIGPAWGFGGSASAASSVCSRNAIQVDDENPHLKHSM